MIGRLTAGGVAAAVLLLSVGCSGTGGQPAAVPAAVTVSPTAPATDPTPAPTKPPAAPSMTTGTMSPPVSPPVSPPAAPAAARRVTPPNLGRTPGCTGCRLRGITWNVRPGVSLALLVGPAVRFREPAMIVSFRTSTGVVTDRFRVREGDYFSDIDGKLSQLACDVIAHCFLPASRGAHSGVLTVVAIQRNGRITLTAAEFGADGPFTAGRDLDGDGIDEVVLVRNDMKPDYASGRHFWQVYKWAGGGFIVVGCANVEAHQTRPPAHLDPAACTA